MRGGGIAASRAFPTSSLIPEAMGPVPNGRTPTLPAESPSMSPPKVPSCGCSVSRFHSSGSGAREAAGSVSQSMREGTGLSSPRGPFSAPKAPHCPLCRAEHFSFSQFQLRVLLALTRTCVTRERQSRRWLQVWVLLPPLPPPPNPQVQIGEGGGLGQCGDIHPHPGPALLRVGLVNVTSLRHHVDEVAGWDHDVVLVQETRLTKGGQRALRSLLRERGWNVFWDAPLNQRHVERDSLHIPLDQ